MRLEDFHCHPAERIDRDGSHRHVAGAVNIPEGHQGREGRARVLQCEVFAKAGQGRAFGEVPLQRRRIGAEGDVAIADRTRPEAEAVDVEGSLSDNRLPIGRGHPH